ncbi:GNAT family N-acetyltransferase [Enterococcus columbae]|uniref:N-acetyltransferase domain-containing protein n=1 Tax=Enterococcus columbae DSM 7374 = ATCC 51263 TaxID=1121865 RepID=S0KAY1_9ENTE|nr:GNAT family N-acetyltransferase [Enterococcus columbae]EOT41827.1 hypothetical protein OMW_01240 [Enterococcus columbae DSM 7374 = ATCC 51263]EOW80681.1 hypothetical protein I568_01859 [Enterococcus columbae DSM 7374 = ATCC 51263]OJG21930.1 hypothetical protein RR47_GL001134 [Enterococcus columbae DSM 7374 = ATCC 51263]
MKSYFQIRAAKKVDWAKLADIYYWSRLKSGCFAPDETSKLLDFKRDTVDEEIYVCLFDEQIVGFLSYYRPDSFIHLLFVDPAFWQNGIGKALLSYAFAEFSRPLTLKCLAHNVKALGFYEHLGFVRGQRVKTSQTKDDYYVLYYDK